jgi:hypothetical protein
VVLGSLQPPPNAERLPEDGARSVSATPVALLVQECGKSSRARVVANGVGPWPLGGWPLGQLGTEVPFAYRAAPVSNILRCAPGP